MFLSPSARNSSICFELVAIRPLITPMSPRARRRSVVVLSTFVFVEARSVFHAVHIGAHTVDFAQGAT